MRITYRQWLAAATLALLAAGTAQAAGPYDPATVHSGEGTYYQYSGGGNCSYPLPASGTYTAAMNNTDYANSQACGAWITVTNPATRQSVRVRIDDRCPECAPGDVDLTQAAFSRISPLAAGRIRINWRHVAGTAAEMKLYFKEGSSRYWTAVQVRDHKYPIRSLSYRRTGSGASFVSVPRASYNYFIASSGMGVGPYDFRIVDVHGRAVVVNNVGLRLTTPISTGKQFPTLSTTAALTASADATVEPVAATTRILGKRSDAGEFCVQVTASNPDRRSREWEAVLPLEGTLVRFSDADIEQEGDIIVVRGMDHNRQLPAGGSTRFEYCTVR